VSPFDFYLSFYGLLLGLSVAEIARGLLNAVGARSKVASGWLTPALALFLLLDITSFWMFAWGIRESLTVSWATMFTGLLIALAYYLAAGLVFPRDISEWPSLDEHYWRHKRIVVAGVLFANAIVLGQALLIRQPVYDAEFWIAQSIYWLPLAILLVSRLRLLDLAMLAALILVYLQNIFDKSSWINP
jgi:hypothetical protein